MNSLGITIARVGCVFWLVELGAIYFYPDTQCARPLLVWQKGQACADSGQR